MALSKIYDTNGNHEILSKSLVPTEHPFIICRYITGGVLKKPKKIGT
jgi:hypothetical protein